MTGYGSGAGPVAGGRVNVEVKSVNHRFLDVTVKGPREYASLEARLAEAVRARVRRGKVDVFVTRETDTGDPNAVQVNLELARGYVSALKLLQGELGLAGDPTLALVSAQRDVLVAGGPKADAETDADAVEAALAGALERLAAMREREGERLAADMREQLAILRRLSAEATARAPKVVDDHRAKLAERLAKLLGSEMAVDPARLAQEVALLADRADVHEELVRLGSHLEQLDAILSAGGEAGRKLDFLLQEVGREINTLGSKANDAELARIVVDLKATAERIREQLQNVE